jgi:hypothetical protein
MKDIYQDSNGDDISAIDHHLLSTEKVISISIST